MIHWKATRLLTILLTPSGMGLSYYFPWRQRNYGPLGYDIRHLLSLNFTWDLPGLGKRSGNKILGAFTDDTRDK